MLIDFDTAILKKASKQLKDGMLEDAILYELLKRLDQFKSVHDQYQKETKKIFREALPYGKLNGCAMLLTSRLGAR
jgi:hypothetical protein